MVDTQTKNPLPVVGSGYDAAMTTFLSEEDAERFTDMLNPFIVENGLHGTGAGLTGNPGNTTAYPGGFYVLETSSIVYPDATANNWVILHKDKVTDPGGNWVRQAGTHYLIDSVSGSEPTAPTGSLIIMRVTTSGGAITVVDDLRNLNAFTTAGDRVKITISDTTARFLAAALVQGSNITLTTLNPGADETLEVKADDAKVTITTNDTTEGVLNDKLLVTAPLTKTTNNPGANETITLDINEIDTADIADNAVTLAKVAHGTADRVHGTDNSGIPNLAQLVEAQIANDAVKWDTKIRAETAGGIPTWNASNDPERIAAGTSGQVLTTQGAGASPAWVSIPRKFEIFVADGTWTQPEGVTTVLIEAMAGGGAGAGETTGTIGTGGGGSGALIRAEVTVSGDVTIQVGLGGVADTDGGASGEDTTFGALVTAKGGSGGATGSNGAGGLGGDLSTTTTTGTLLDKNAGQDGEAGSDGTFGGAGGDSAILNGSNGGARQTNNNTTGNAGVAKGTGGSGVRRTTGSITGGDGEDGYVIVWW